MAKIADAPQVESNVAMILPGERQQEMDRGKIMTLPKVLLHEHLNCSVRPSSLLEFCYDENWRVPDNFPARARQLFEQKKIEEAAEVYQSFLAQEASTSLANYVMVIGHHVLPLIQSASRLTRVVKERIEDAKADGVVALELRFAPQNHMVGGLTTTQVMEAMIDGIDSAPMPVRLILCALRHENEEKARQLADLAIAYKDYVGVFDLAGDEKANPGVLPWWAKQAHRVREHGIDINIHLWETNEPTEDDMESLAALQIKRLGHGIRGSLQGDRILEVCLSSNLVTGQIKSLSEHPVDSLYRQGKRVTVNTDGTLLTRSDLSNEYQLLHRHFGWGESEFFDINKTAIEASSFSAANKANVMTILVTSYKQQTGALRDSICEINGFMQS